MWLAHFAITSVWRCWTSAFRPYGRFLLLAWYLCLGPYAAKLFEMPRSQEHNNRKPELETRTWTYPVSAKPSSGLTAFPRAMDAFVRWMTSPSLFAPVNS